VIQKKEPAGARNRSHAHLRAGRPEKVSRNAETQLKNWIQNDRLYYVPVGDAVHGLPEGLLGDFNTMKNALYLKKAGVRIGKEAENGWIPDHELALADILNEIPEYLDLDKPETLKYLRGEALESGNGRKGWRLVRYLGKGLGWIKMLDKRINNYYPASWRIRL